MHLNEAQRCRGFADRNRIGVRRGLSWKMAISVGVPWKMRRTTNAEHNRTAGDRHTSPIADRAEAA
jgi:hypothetical protein